MAVYTKAAIASQLKRLAETQEERLATQFAVHSAR